MYRTPLVLTCVAVATANMQVLPTICREDVHCPSGSFCEPQQLSCRQCLNCEDLKREAPQFATSCVTSVAECGSCFAGLVEGKLNGGGCIPHNIPTEPPPLPYDWPAIIISLLLFALMICVALVVLLRNFKAYMLRSSTSATVHSPCQEVVVPASAPKELPPPYNSVAVLPSPNCHRLQEESLPFIKPILTSRPANGRQSANHQAARVFSNPTYEQEGSFPPSYETVSLPDQTNGGVPSALGGANINNAVDANDNEPPAPADIGNVVPPVHAPTPMRHRVRQDSNNNSEDSEESYTGSCNPSFLAQNSCPFVINVIKNITTVQQHNDLSL